jgi:3-oxosteroid 1-dehydrogenase
MAGFDHEVDFIAVGSGLAGLTAAIRAHDAGLRVLVLEKSAKAGGVCAYSGGEVFVPGNHKMAEAGLSDSPEAGRDYLRFLGGGYEVPELQDTLLRVGPEAARYVEQKAGVRWKIVQGFPDYHHPHAPGTAAAGRYLEVELFDGATLGPWQKPTWQTPHLPPGITHDELFAWGGLATILHWDFRLMGKRLSKDQRGFGPGMMAYFVKAVALDRGIPLWLESPARALLTEGGAVVGVLTQRDGKDFRVRATRGVLLGVGGYDWHPELPKYYEGLPTWVSAVQPSVTGDNHLLGGEVGAAFAGVPPYNLGMFFGYQVPGEEHDGRPLYRASWEGGYPHALWVNRAGQRFCDESFYRDYLPRCHAWDGKQQVHPNLPPFLILDQNFRENYSFGTFMPGAEIPEALMASGETPRELAVKLGIDPDGLERTLARYNTFVETDPDYDRGRYPWANMMFGDKRRPNPHIGPVCKPPFRGLALRPVGVGINAVGLRTDVHGRVLHVRGHAIPGLYAAGNSAAALDTGAGYQSGLSNLRGLTWGFIAAQHAASR